MTQTKSKTLYDQDFYQWIEQTISHLKSGNLEALDRDNLIEEIEALGKREKRELESRLSTLFEHALKRKYVPLEECYRGWEVTLRRAQKEILKILRDSPSLKGYMQNIFLECYQEALENMQIEYDVEFPQNYPFPTDCTQLLTQSLAPVNQASEY
ncbi:DUF29 domain-containing protein [Picosynechococcus sp. PCC 8807]|uniref:DUF29 domain-containing protein n=1 Tax=Picosynechococcus sp. PCC 8807 TaxID=195248 RepID=UPI000810E4E3|nr:DUF29 domain-containing protein [Picosynechococcus sp. PCC 8807]ANV89727.1 hypothetical protein AWQ24_03260 [Picosynechococcus sp. PCC 8807]